MAASRTGIARVFGLGGLLLLAAMATPVLAEDGAPGLRRSEQRPAPAGEAPPRPRDPGSRALYERDPASAPFTRGWTTGPSDAPADDRPRARIRPNIDIVIDPTRRPRNEADPVRR